MANSTVLLENVHNAQRDDVDPQDDDLNTEQLKEVKEKMTNKAKTVTSFRCFCQPSPTRTRAQDHRPCFAITVALPPQS